MADSLQRYRNVVTVTPKKSQMKDSMTMDVGTEKVQGINPIGMDSSESDLPQNDKPPEMFDNATVQKVVARERMKAYEKGKRDKEMEFQQQQDATPQNNDAPQAQPSSLGGIPQMSQADIERMIAEKSREHLQEQIPEFLQGKMQEHKNEQFVNSFVSKMQAAEQKFPGLEAKLNKLDYQKPGTRALMEMANGLENTGEIMQEILIANPMKFAQLVNLIYEQPELAQDQLAALSNSIKQNQDALASHDSANNPLSQMKPSTIAGMDKGNMSVSDYSAYFRNKKAGR